MNRVFFIVIIILGLAACKDKNTVNLSDPLQSGRGFIEESLKGKKMKGGFLGIKGSYQGTFSHTITVPAGMSDVSVRVVSKDGSTDLTIGIKMPPPGGFVPVLVVEVDSEHLALSWKGSQ